MVIARGIELGIAQEQLAELHDPGAVGRQPLEVKLMVGFETEAGERELVAIEPGASAGGGLRR